MGKQITVRGVSPELAKRLEALASEREMSVNATVLDLLEQAVGVQGRRARLERYATWNDSDLEAFDAELRAQRAVDEHLWR